MDIILKKILETIENNGISQKEITEKLGLTETVFSNWKAGKNESYKKKLPQIAKILGVTIEYLTGEESEQAKILRLYTRATTKEKEIIQFILKEYEK